jgi:hypothetical protein
LDFPLLDFPLLYFPLLDFPFLLWGRYSIVLSYPPLNCKGQAVDYLFL